MQYQPLGYRPSDYRPSDYRARSTVYHAASAPPAYLTLDQPRNFGGTDHPSPLNRRRRLSLLLAVLAAVLFPLVVGGGAAVARSALDGPPGAARAVGARGGADAAPTSGRDQALTALLSRRATAIGARDQAGFLADVDKADPAFVKRQQLVYQNMTKLPIVDVAYRVHDTDQYEALAPAEITSRYPGGTKVRAVTISYRVDGVDDKPVAVPWVPIFAAVDARWMLVGEVVNKDLPAGVGGQAWDAGSITVASSRRVVGVFTAGTRDHPQQLLKLAEQALDRVAGVRPGGWVGKIFLVAVRDRTVFDAYFGHAPERIEQVAAIAVPHYDKVHEWASGAEYAATRVIFNPDELSEDNRQIADDLTHEFTHAAMAPVTSGWTPTWLVEGFAEYVSYKGMQVQASALRRALRGVATDDLLTGEKFYAEPMNYVTGWLACRMIAEKWGEAKLVELYEGFQSTSSEDVVVTRVLEVTRAALVQQWQEYVAKQRS